MKYAFSRFSTVSCFMERASSSFIAFITTSVCPWRRAAVALSSKRRRNPALTGGAEVLTGGAEVLAMRISLPSFERRRQQRNALLRLGLFLNLDLGNEDSR